MKNPLIWALLLSFGLHGFLIFSGNRISAARPAKRLIEIKVVQKERKIEPPKKIKLEKLEKPKKAKVAKKAFRFSKRFALAHRIPLPPRVFGVSKSNYAGDLNVAEGNTLAADPELSPPPSPPPPLPEREEKLKFWPTGECDKPPVPLVSIQPVYPDFAKTGGITGKVVLEIDIDSTGHVVEVRVLKSAHSCLSEAAIHAVRHARFSPALKDGERVAVTMRYPFTFSLSE